MTVSLRRWSKSVILRGQIDKRSSFWRRYEQLLRASDATSDSQSVFDFRAQRLPNPISELKRMERHRAIRCEPWSKANHVSHKQKQGGQAVQKKRVNPLPCSRWRWPPHFVHPLKSCQTQSGPRNQTGPSHIPVYMTWTACHSRKQNSPF